MRISCFRSRWRAGLAVACLSLASCAHPSPPSGEPAADAMVPARQPREPAQVDDSAAGTLSTSDGHRGVRSMTLHYPRDEDVSTGCIATGQVSRALPSQGDPLRSALGALLDGPTEEEQAVAHVFSPFDESPSAPAATDLGRHLLGVSVERGLATVDFASDAEMFFLQAACPAAMVTSSIEQTLLQFAGIRDVRFAIEGQPITQWEGDVGPNG